MSPFRRLLVFALLFIFSMTSPWLVVQITQSPAIAQVQPGKSSYAAGNYEAAARELQAAADNFAAVGDKLSQSIALRNLSLVYQQLGRWTEASQAVSQSLAILQGLPKNDMQQKYLAQALDVQGRLLWETAKPADALSVWEQATNLYQLLGDAMAVTQGRLNQATALQDLGFYPKACNTLREALGLNSQIRTSESARVQCSLNSAELQTLKNLPVSPVNVLGLRSFGDVLHNLGELEQSQVILQQSLEAAKKLQLPADMAAAYLSLGRNSLALGIKHAQEPELEQKYQQEAMNAFKAAERYASPLGQLQARLNQLRLLVEGSYRTAARNFAAEQWQSFQPLLTQYSGRATVQALLNFIQSLLTLAKADPNNDYPPLEPILKTALERAQALGDRKSQAYVLGSWGKFYELKQQWQNAQNFTNQALSLISPATSPDIAYQLFWQLGRIYKGSKDLDNAIAHYTQAVNTLASVRSDLVTANPDVQFSFRESVEPVYRQLVSLLLTPGSGSKGAGGLGGWGLGSKGEAGGLGGSPSPSHPSLFPIPHQASQEMLKQARQVIESLQLAELDNFFQDACAMAKPQQIDRVDPTAAVFYAIILSDRLEVILSIPGQPLRHYTTTKSSGELEEIFQKTRTSLRRTAFPQESLPLAQQLYDWLIRPAEADLAKNNIQTLVFVLDGALRNLPMAALHDGKQYLIQKYNIALTPGLQLLEPRPLTKEQINALTAALSESRQGFPPLPETITEVKQISSEVKATVLLNEQFTRSKLQELITAIPFPVVHLATHGQFSSNAEDTFILAWDERINVKQLDRLLRKRKPGERPIELFVLSACETAAGDNRAALGMAGIAIRSGARATVATMWQVNDESTAMLMTQFYEELTKPGVTKVQALRNAQLALLSQPDYQNPFFWAPFILIGNWQ